MLCASVAGFSPQLVGHIATGIIRDRYLADEAELPPRINPLAIFDVRELWT